METEAIKLPQLLSVHVFADHSPLSRPDYTLLPSLFVKTHNAPPHVDTFAYRDTCISPAVFRTNQVIFTPWIIPPSSSRCTYSRFSQGHITYASQRNAVYVQTYLCPIIDLADMQCVFWRDPKKDKDRPKPEQPRPQPKPDKRKPKPERRGDREPQEPRVPKTR